MRGPGVGPRADGLPEGADYRDTGCSVAPRCLACPLPRCRYDEPLGGARRILNESRDAEIASMAHRGMETTAIAQHFGVSRRTIFRVLRVLAMGDPDAVD